MKLARYASIWLVAAASLACTEVSAQTTPGAAPSADDALIQRGAYLAKVGDCMACHTAQGGKPFAGGLPLPTPIGTIYSSNITPDKETGIGTYSYADFDRALRQGIAKSGDTLYPAMPYPSYAHVKPGDVQALYAYFMHGVAPVHQDAKASQIPWPLSMRWPLALWRRAFAPIPVTDTDDGGSNSSSNNSSDAQQLARGRYLVEGLGHCGACHTPRGVAYQELALGDTGSGTFLSGGVVEHWLAQNLRGDPVDGLGAWHTDEIVSFLKSGRNAHSAAFGSMSEVVEDSTQYMSDADLQAVAAYLKSLTPVHAGGTALSYNDTTGKTLHGGNTSQPGALVFLNNCAACHRSDGKGYAGVFPALAQNTAVNAADPVSLIHLVLRGSSMPGTAAAPTIFTMPDFSHRLSDAQIADVVSFIRSAWGNHAGAVEADEVRKIRAATQAQ